MGSNLARGKILIYILSTEPLDAVNILPLYFASNILPLHFARGKIFTASIGSVDSLYPSVYTRAEQKVRRISS